MEKGQFQTSLVSLQSNDINKVIINPVHGLVVTGGNEGKLEAWDPRSGSCIASLDCAMNSLMEGDKYELIYEDIMEYWVYILVMNYSLQCK